MTNIPPHNWDEPAIQAEFRQLHLWDNKQNSSKLT